MTDDQYLGSGNRVGHTSDDFYSYGQIADYTANGVGRADFTSAPVTHLGSDDSPLCGWSAPNESTSADITRVDCLDCLAARNLTTKSERRFSANGEFPDLERLPGEDDE